MRVCLVGTSNAVFKNGYVSAIANDSRITSLERFTIGASPSIIIPYFLSNIDFSHFDVLIVDTAINDRNYYIEKSIRKEQIREYLEWIVAKASSSGCRVALLVMPTRSAFNRETISGLIYRRVAEETGSLFVDGYSYIQKKANDRNLSISDLFIDEHHIILEVARELGAHIAETIHKPSRLPSIKRTLPDFYTIDLTSLPDVSPVFRSTSLVTRNFAAIEKSTIIKVPLPTGDEIVGITVNAAVTSGAVLIDGNSSFIKDLDAIRAKAGKMLQMVVLPIATAGVTSTGDCVHLSLAPNDAKRSERSRFKKKEGEPYLEVGELIIKTARRH